MDLPLARFLGGRPGGAQEVGGSAPGSLLTLWYRVGGCVCGSGPVQPARAAASTSRLARNDHSGIPPPPPRALPSAADSEGASRSAKGVLVEDLETLFVTIYVLASAVGERPQRTFSFFTRPSKPGAASCAARVRPLAWLCNCQHPEGLAEDSTRGAASLPEEPRRGGRLALSGSSTRASAPVLALTADACRLASREHLRRAKSTSGSGRSRRGR